VREDHGQLQKNVDELHKDRAELRRDIRSGASRKEIAQDRREIRDDVRKVSANKKDLQQSQEKLQAARKELREDSHRR
jgi:seryl-tRNA synthetase